MPDTLPTLGHALRSMPTPQPPADGWSRLQQSIEAEPAPIRVRWLAWAAVLAMAGLLTALPRLDAPPAEVAATPGPATAEPDLPSLAALQSESARWDLFLARSPTPVDSPATALAQATLVDRIAVIDLLLDAPRAPEQAQALWGERVLLLRELVRLRNDGALQLASIPPLVEHDRHVL